MFQDDPVRIRLGSREGEPIIDSVDQTDFAATVNVLANNSPISHTMTLLMIFGVLLMAFGVMPLFRLTGGQRSLAWTASSTTPESS